MDIIPAIDLIDGKCVRLTEGDFTRQTTYHADPAEMAKRFEAAGLRRLHLVDLDGARAGSVQNWKVLEAITAATDLVVDFGGGIKTEEEVRRVFDSGAELATVGSIAVKNEPLLLEWFGRFGAGRFLLGADVRDEKISVAGWQESTEIDIFSFIEKYSAHGVRQLFCTDVRKDGRLEGPSLDLYERIISRFPDIFFIASGGVSGMDDLHALRGIGCRAAIVGKAIYEDRISPDEAAAFARQMPDPGTRDTRQEENSTDPKS